MEADEMKTAEIAETEATAATASTGKIEKAVQWMLKIANDNSHGYSQDNRWGPDYDCSSFIISAWQQAGVPVKTNGASYTGNMKSVFLKCGFSNVTSKINVDTQNGLQRGDVLLNEASHTATYIGSGKIVSATGTKGIRKRETRQEKKLQQGHTTISHGIVSFGILQKTAGLHPVVPVPAPPSPEMPTFV